MAFNPDKFLAETAPVQDQRIPASGGFDPDKFLTETEPAPERKAEAFTQGFGNAATFGYLPQLQSAAEPIVQKVFGLFGDNTDKDLEAQGFTIDQPEQDYVGRRDQYIREGQELAKENPYSSAAGNVAGAIASGVGTSAGLAKLIGAGSKASLGGRVAQAAKAGAAVGAIRNPGDTEGEVNLIQAGDRLKNTATDAATGAILQGGMEGLGKVGSAIKNSGKNLKTYSELKALKAGGAMLKDFRKALGKGKASDLGKEIIDEGIVSYGDDIADIAKKAEDALSKSGKKIGEVYKKADGANKGGITSNDIKSLSDEYNNEAASRLSGTIDGEEIAQKVSKVMDTLTENRNPTFGELRKMRASIDNKINYAKSSNDLPEFQSELLEIRGKIQKLISKKLGDVNPELRKEFTKENRKFSNLSDISKFAKDKLAREESNQAFGLSEKLATGAGGVMGSIVGGPVGTAVGLVTAPAIAKASRQYGTPFVALTANKIAKALESNPGILGKFSDPLIKAASVSPEKFVATVNNLIKDPEFKKSTNNFEDLNNFRPRLGENTQDQRVVKFTRKNQ